MLPLENRPTHILKEQVRRLENLYQISTDDFSKMSFTDSITEALQKISNAITDIENEIRKRT